MDACANLKSLGILLTERYCQHAISHQERLNRGEVMRSSDMDANEGEVTAFSWLPLGCGKTRDKNTHWESKFWLGLELVSWQGPSHAKLHCCSVSLA